MRGAPMAWSDAKGRGAGKRPIPDAEGQCPHLSLGPLHRGVGRRHLQSTLPSCNRGARAGCEQVPPPALSLSSPLTAPPLPASPLPHRVSEDMPDTPRASLQPPSPEIVAGTRNTCMKLLLLHVLAFTLGGPEASAAVHRRGGALWASRRTHPAPGWWTPPSPLGR